MISHWANRPVAAKTPTHIHCNVRNADDGAKAISAQLTPSYAFGTARKTGPVKYFLVEDNVIIRENLADTLHEMVGAEIVGIADAQTEAIEWLCDSSHEWDVAVVDIFLKRGNGVQVVSALQQFKQLKRVIVLSNYASSEIRNECLRLGADAVFDKSTELDDLIEYCIKVQTH